MTSRSSNKNQSLKHILVLHGPNLNLLGERQPEIYGAMTLTELNQKLTLFASQNNCELRIHQSNSEGTLIDLLHEHRKLVDGIILNPGAYTHYSYAIRDAVASISIPTIEVHLSDIHQREAFRKISVIAPVCIKQISGLGLQSYIQAIELLLWRELQKG